MLRVLKRDGHEIASHGLNHLNALDFVNSNSLEAYIAEEIIPSIHMMEKDNLKPTSFAYPFGARTEEIDAALLEIFKIIRGTTYTNSKIRLKDLDSVYYMPGRSNGLVFGVGIDGIYNNTIEEILKGIDRARDKGEILVVYAHIIGDDEDDYSYMVSKNKLERILQYVKENDMVFYTMSEVAN
jgi:peptidoglycan/xylan/chitin deacetylase (PgdA/CDA1 family)